MQMGSQPFSLIKCAVARERGLTQTFSQLETFLVWKYLSAECACVRARDTLLAVTLILL